MTTLILTFAAMLLLTAAMAVGVIFGRKPIAGSCGGMKALGMETECEVCGGQPAVQNRNRKSPARVEAACPVTPRDQGIGQPS